jgi:predicted neutral ceramidase superfamily lipid hydrolase
MGIPAQSDFATKSVDHSRCVGLAPNGARAATIDQANGRSARLTEDTNEKVHVGERRSGGADFDDRLH